MREPMRPMESNPHDAETTVTLKPLAELRELWAPGEEDEASVLLEIFEREAPRLIALLEQERGSGDAAGAHRTAHKLKGSAAAIGATSLGVLADTMSVGAAEGHVPTDAALQALRRHFERSREQFRAFCRTPLPGAAAPPSAG